MWELGIYQCLGKCVREGVGCMVFLQYNSSTPHIERIAYE